MLITENDSPTLEEAHRTVRAASGAPSHLKHDRIALLKVVYFNSKESS